MSYRSPNCALDTSLSFWKVAFMLEPSRFAQEYKRSVPSDVASRYFFSTRADDFYCVTATGACVQGMVASCGNPEIRRNAELPRFSLFQQPFLLLASKSLMIDTRSAPVNLSDPSREDPPADQPPYRLRPLLSDVSLTGVSGSFQFHDLLSSDRSVSGHGAIGLTGRAGFLLDVPRLKSSTSGFVDASALAAVDTDLGTAGVRLRGGAVLGDLSGLHLAVTGSATLRMPVPERLRLGDLPASP